MKHAKITTLFYGRLPLYQPVGHVLGFALALEVIYHHEAIPRGICRNHINGDA